MHSILYYDPEGADLRERLNYVLNAAIWVIVNDSAEMTRSGFLNPCKAIVCWLKALQ